MKNYVFEIICHIFVSILDKHTTNANKVLNLKKWRRTKIITRFFKSIEEFGCYFVWFFVFKNDQR